MTHDNPRGLSTVLLLVNDHADTLDSMRSAFSLRLPTASIVTAATFEQALDQIEESRPRVVVTDFHLRGYGDGLGAQVAEAAHDAMADLVVLVSGSFSERDVAHWQDADYVDRAFSSIHLVELIEFVVAFMREPVAPAGSGEAS